MFILKHDVIHIEYIYKCCVTSLFFSIFIQLGFIAVLFESVTNPAIDIKHENRIWQVSVFFLNHAYKVSSDESQLLHCKLFIVLRLFIYQRTNRFWN